MPDTFESILVVAIALLPGALYVGALERFLGAWWSRTADRVFRYLEGSAVLHALLAPLTYRLWVDHIASGRVRAGSVSIAAWGWLLLYVFGPLALGALVGYGARERATGSASAVRRWGWTRLITGPAPAPRAWDFFFSTRPDGWIRMRLKSGAWIGGAYARKPRGLTSYASGYPERQDIYLSDVADIDPKTGAFELDTEGEPSFRGSGVLIRWEEVEYLEFIDG